MLGKKENYFAPSCAVVVVNLGAQDIVGHFIAELIDRSLSRDTWRYFFTAVERRKMSGWCRYKPGGALITARNDMLFENRVLVVLHDSR